MSPRERIPRTFLRIDIAQSRRARRKADAHHFQPKPLGLAYVLEIDPVELLPFLLRHPVTDDTLVAHASLLARAGYAALTPITCRSALDRRLDSSLAFARRLRSETVGSSHPRGAVRTFLREASLILAQRDGENEVRFRRAPLADFAVSPAFVLFVRAFRRHDASSPTNGISPSPFEMLQFPLFVARRRRRQILLFTF